MLRSSAKEPRCLLSLVSCLALAGAPVPARAEDEAVETSGAPTAEAEPSPSAAADEDPGRRPAVHRAPIVEEVPQSAPQVRAEDERTGSPALSQVLKRRPPSVWTSQAAEDQCPLCGRTHDQREAPGLFSWTLKPQGPAESSLLDPSAGEPGKLTRRQGNRLRPGETASILVQVRERLGPTALSGTSFDDQPSDGESAADDGASEASSRTFVEWIQALDDEHRREASPAWSLSKRSGVGASPLCADAAAEPCDEAFGLDADQAALRIELLRQASRELSRAAEMLEEGDLFDQADEIHRIAGDLRRQARALVLSRRARQGEATMAR